MTVPNTPENEKARVKQLMDEASDMNVDDKWCMVSARWWRHWSQYTNYDGAVSLEFIDPLSAYIPRRTSLQSRPLAIDNTDLLKHPSPELKDALVEDKDYTLVPLSVWTELQNWYGGSPIIERNVISHGLRKELVVEVYPLKLNLKTKSLQRTLEISKSVTVGALKDRVSKLLNLLSEDFQLWDHFGGESKLLSDPTQTLEDAGIQSNQDILVQEKEGGKFPDSPPAVSAKLAVIPITKIGNGKEVQGPLTRNRLAASGETDDWLMSADFSAEGRGLTGLQNLGNTCFMNSALQCLVHTQPLVEYFLSDFTREVNKTNPLGMEGQLALAFGKLLRNLWRGDRAPIAPREFKAQLARFAPQFSGYNQHDSQELLAFLLDGLHEDLNRVLRKPYIETKDSDGRPDEEVAEEAWENHRARNDSIIVDVCQGQYKSTLVCLTCGKTSVTFDPFMYLSLPLPNKNTRSLSVTIYSSTSLPEQVTVTVSKGGTVKDLYDEVEKACRVSSEERLLLTELYNNRVYRYFDDPKDLLSGIRDDDKLAAYRLPQETTAESLLVIFHRRLQNSLYSIRGQTWEAFGAPFLTYIPEGTKTGSDLHALVRRVLQPFAKSEESPESESYVTSQEVEMDEVDASEESSVRKPEEEASTSEKVDNDRTPFELLATDEKAFGREVIEDDNNDIPEDSIFLRDKANPRHIVLEWQASPPYDLEKFESSNPAGRLLGRKAKQDPVSLVACLEGFLKEEPLGPDDMWYCPQCKEHRQANKKLDLWKLPEVLVVHLKRFSYSRIFKTKLDTFVDFPVESFELAPWVTKASQGSLLYDLYAVSNHYGGMGGGHYTAYARVSNGKWYNFDDSHVAPLGEDVKSAAAYVLFYRRRGGNVSRALPPLTQISPSKPLVEGSAESAGPAVVNDDRSSDDDVMMS